ncbi:imelysin family protein [Acaryochloris marina]|uniref:imelysin family protein n=1 Tax=Acaryochloris marina TaxID=155978 RepID=UPI001BB00C7F|nr:imelysin family protein [Acaryochloris marina]QUY42874.1 iron-regulated protein [Acaryochloris marina S15]
MMISPRLSKTLSCVLLCAVTCSTVAVANAHHHATTRRQQIAVKDVDLKPYVENYAEVVYRNYQDAHTQAAMMKVAITAFLNNPNETSHKAAQDAWVQARKSYLQTEAFRFYEGPIDFVDAKTGEEGPEGRINAWPMNEAFIDYVKEKPDSGLINNPKFEISIASILESDQVTDEADVSTGWHAIEFLLWGQDFNNEGPGQRNFEDFIPNQNNNDRRRQYLTLVTQQLVSDLTFLEAEWKPNAENYRAKFLQGDPKATVGKIFTALATLSAFEMASERMTVALDSGNQEDEHSCFSDTTHQDFVFNAKGISNVYFGDYAGYQGKGFDELLAQMNPDLNQKITAALTTTQESASQIDQPFDQVLASAQGSPPRAEVEAVVTALENQGEAFKELGPVLGTSVEILAE